MTDEELIGYCDIHCETERALFNAAQINRMLDLAGNPEGFAKQMPLGWYSVHAEMKDLVQLARDRLRQAIARPSGETLKLEGE